jgi:mono/diheme cytochrome c family protein
MAVCRLRPLLALLALGVFPAALHAQEAGNAAVSGEADFNLYCASCHGQDGKGDGPKAFGLSGPLPDLTTLTQRYGAFPADKLARIIDGRDVLEGHLDREMPVWGVWFREESDAELGGALGDVGSVARRVENLVRHLESLQATP